MKTLNQRPNDLIRDGVGCLASMLILGGWFWLTISLARNPGTRLQTVLSLSALCLSLWLFAVLMKEGLLRSVFALSTSVVAFLSFPALFLSWLWWSTEQTTLAASLLVLVVPVAIWLAVTITIERRRAKFVTNALAGKKLRRIKHCRIVSFTDSFKPSVRRHAAMYDLFYLHVEDADGVRKDVSVQVHGDWFGLIDPTVEIRDYDRNDDSRSND